MKSFSKVIMMGCSVLMLSAQGLASSGDVGAASASGEAIENGICEDYQQMIVNNCSGNPAMQKANNGLAAMQLFQQGGTAEAGNGKTGQEIERVGMSSQVSIKAARQQCQQTFDQCQTKCTEKYNQALAENNAERAKQGTLPGPNPAILQQSQADMNQANTVIKACQTEKGKSLAATGAKLAEIVQLLESVGKILKALGIKSATDGQAVVDSSEVEDDEQCAATDLTPECAGQSDPLSSRAGTGQTGVAGLSGEQGQSLFGQAEEGEPGGDPAAAAKAAGARNSGSYGGSGFGGFGSGSSGSGSGSSGVGKAGLDTDIHKGYMGGGGSGGGAGFGAYGGGGGSARRSRSSGYSKAGSSGVARNRLQSALNRVANNGGRGIASEGTKNGPLQNIWGVMSKTYKKASPSMYHNE